MTKLPRLPWRKVVAALERAGFVLARSGAGGHRHYVHRSDPTRHATVPTYSGDLAPKTLSAILKQARLSRDDFIRLL